MSIQTPVGIYSPTRTLQGGTDSGNHFQSVTREKFEGKVQRMLQWLDDFLIHAKDENELLSDIAAFLEVCTEVGFKVNPKKSCSFTTEVKFCGRIISSEGVQFDPRNFEAVLAMKPPRMGDELQQLLCATNWMRTSIPQYSQLVEPLHQLLEEACQKAGKRTKKALQKVKLEWNETHSETFEHLKEQLAEATKLALPKEGYRLCLFTDASDTHWAAVLTQSPENEQKKPIEKQTHEPLCFLSGAFTGSSERWSVPEKEGFAIVESMCRLDYLTVGRLVSIYTDHANLVYIYDPYGRDPGIARHTANQLTRWALKLNGFRFVIKHLPGERNVWADMLTRWAVQLTKTVQSANIGRVRALMSAPINPGIDDAYDWPSLQDIIQSQDENRTSAPKRAHEKEGAIRMPTGQIWIPDGDHKLQLRILIAAHTGKGGHRAADPTFQTVAAHFCWKDLRRRTMEFTASCLHCIATEPGKVFPRPLGHTLHADKPNELLHFDYCYMHKGDKSKLYTLVVKDNLSGYVWLKSTEEADSDTTADVLVDWFACFGVARSWISDQGSHFKNKLVKSLAQKLKADHHFTLPYCPWSNGFVEVVCRELLRACRALLSEFQLPQSAWPSVLPLVQSALNSAPTRRLNGKCPLTVFTGLPQDSPLAAILRSQKEVSTVGSIDSMRARALVEVERVHEALHKMHRNCAEHARRQRKSSVDAHNRRTRVRAVDFTEGDYVLKTVLQRNIRAKTSLKWNGPFRVTACREQFIFEVENLLDGKKELVHGRRLKLFRNKDFEISEDIKDHLAYQQNELLVIEDFEDIRRRSNQVELLVKWTGFSREESDWVNIDSLRTDVPELLEEYLEETKKSGTRRQRNLISAIGTQ